MKKLRKLIKESLLNESMTMHIKDYPYKLNLETLGDISHYIVRILEPVMMKDFTPEEIETVRGFYNDITPDGDGYFDETGIINFYTRNFPERVIKPYLSRVKYELSEKNIKMGEPKIEDSSIRRTPVVRIPILKNEYEVEHPPFVNFSNSNARQIFRDVLNYDDGEIEGSMFSVPELLMKISTAESRLFTFPKKSSNEVGGKNKNIYDFKPGQDYMEGALEKIKIFVNWANERGYQTIYLG